MCTSRNVYFRLDLYVFLIKKMYTQKNWIFQQAKIDHSTEEENVKTIQQLQLSIINIFFLLILKVYALSFEVTKNSCSSWSNQLSSILSLIYEYFLTQQTLP